MRGQDIEITELNLKRKIESERRLEPLFKELARIAARKARSAFGALLEQGFKRNEALDMIMHSGVFEATIVRPGEDPEPDPMNFDDDMPF